MAKIKDLMIPHDEWKKIKEEEKIIRKLKGEPEPKTPFDISTEIMTRNKELTDHIEKMINPLQDIIRDMLNDPEIVKEWNKEND